MKNKKILVTILLAVSTLALTACGNSAASVSAVETEKNQVVENTTTTESETLVKESVIPETTETAVEGESEIVSSESEKPSIDPNFNGTGYKGTLQETVQTYITYTPIDPTQMYVISNTNGERYSTYHDLNLTEGELVVSGLVEPNQEIIIDGKGTYNNIDYYRIAFQETMMLNHQIIIPAECLTAEKQETPVETEKPVEQQPEVQQPTDPLPPVAEPTVPEWTPDTGVSKEDWDKFFGGVNTTGQHTWQPDGNDNMTIDKNGNIWDPDIDMDKVGNLIVH